MDVVTYREVLPKVEAAPLVEVMERLPEVIEAALLKDPVEFEEIDRTESAFCDAALGTFARCVATNLPAFLAYFFVMACIVRRIYKRGGNNSVGTLHLETLTELPR